MLLVLRRLRNFPMLGLLILLFALMSLKANWVLGAPYLFWHDDFIQGGILALLAVGLLLEEWAFVAVLLDTDENNPINLTTPGQHHSRISLIASVKDYLEIEKISETGNDLEIQPEDSHCTVLTSAAGGMSELSEEDQSRIFATVREVHSVGTYTLAFLFGFLTAYVYQWQNENLIAFSGIGLVGYQMTGIDLLGPILIGLGLTLMVYVMFLTRRAILLYEEPLTRYCKKTHNLLSHIPWLGPILGDWVFQEIIRDDNLFRSFHLIAFVKNLISVIFILLLSIVFWSGFRSSADPSVALIVCVVLSGLLGVYGWMVFQRRRMRYEFVIGLMIVLMSVVVLRINTVSQSVRLAASPSTLIPENADQALEMVKAEAIRQNIERAIWTESISEPMPADWESRLQRTEWLVLDRWKQYANRSLVDPNGSPVAPTQKPILVVVSNTGGGIKAQVWSSVVLSAIENHLSRPDENGHFTQFFRHVRLIAGASGGMVGAGYWVATLNGELKWHSGESEKASPLFHFEKDPGTDQYSALTTEEIVDRMSGNCLSQVARQGFFNDLLGIPLRLAGMPLPTRGEALEDAFIGFGPAFETPFRAMGNHENTGTLPSLIYTPTSANDGRRFLISNQPLEYLFYAQYSNSHAAENEEDDRESIGTYSWRLNYPDSDMTLATAARLSANFPVVVDSPHLPFNEKRDRLQIMDAGYGDNHGVYPLAVWINANRDWIRNNTSGLVLIQIAASSLPRNSNQSPAGSLSPEILGFATTSFNKTLFHADQLLEQAADYFNQTDDEFFKVVTFAYDGEASLSWYLSRVEKLSLVYPFLSDQQVRKIVPRSSNDEFIIPLNNAIADQVVTVRSTDLTNSDMVSGYLRFRMDDFRKSEQLRVTMGRQLAELKTWWKRRRDNQ